MKNTIYWVLPFFLVTNALAQTKSDLPKDKAKASNSKNRRCVDTGLSARCGDAMKEVKCDGYDQPYFIANNQKITNLTIDLYVGKPSENFPFKRTRISDFAKIEKPSGAIREYSSAMVRWGRDLLKGDMQFNSSDKSQKDYQNAIKDLIVAVKNKNPEIKVDPLVDDIDVGSFEIPKDADLYLTCYTSKGVAPKLPEPKVFEEFPSEPGDYVERGMWVPRKHQ
jgi:hypothetical protein